MTTEPPTLSPSQQRAFAAIAAYWPIGTVFALSGDSGMGKSTILRSLQQRFGGTVLGSKQWLETLGSRHPLALEESFVQVVTRALAEHDTVFVDDLHVPVMVGKMHSYPRYGLIDGALDVVVTCAVAAGKRIVFAFTGWLHSAVQQRAIVQGVKELVADDYAHFARHCLGEARSRHVDAHKLYRFAPRLDGHQLTLTFRALGLDGRSPTTEQVVDHLRATGMTSNVNLGEVEPVDLRDLKGVDDLIESLEAKIVLPLENDRLATELGIVPKRGVLIAGPPGTGKTTIGRALAHRLKSKFFLVDGTFISGTRSFYQDIARVFESAKRNAPSIIFIDDSDVIFEDSRETGLYRYLLTMLDGLESESAGQVCVIMTAMDIGNLPPALVRSGRVELWLETRLPDAAARAAILRGRLDGLPDAFSSIDVDVLAAASEGLTGADLRQVVEDGKLLFAHDVARSRPRRPATEYFRDAVATVRTNRERYAKAEAVARARRGKQPPWFTTEAIDECG